MPVEYRTISIVRSVRLSRGIDQPGDFLVAQDLRQPTRDFGIRHVLEQVAPLQRLHEEEAERRDVELDRRGPSFRSRSRYA